MERLGVRTKAWLRLKPATGQPPAGLLVCFPHAGGNASAYGDWPAQLGPSFQVAAVRPPGRHERIAEEPCRSITEAADAVVREIGLMAPCHIALFGHSMGALTAFETARSLRRLGGQAPDLLVLSAPPPPNTSTDAAVARMAWCSDQELLELCSALGADDMRRLATDPEKRKFILNPLRDDLASVARYSILSEQPLEIVTRLLVGSADPSRAPDLAARWREVISGELVVRTYAGGHFFVRSARKAVLDDLARDLAIDSREPCQAQAIGNLGDI